MVYYKLEIDREKKFIEGTAENDWEGILCPKDSGHQRAGRRITVLHIDILSPCVVDFARTMLSDVVITDRALNALRSAGLRGFAIQPTRIRQFPKAFERSLPKLWELVVIGKGGNAHYKSGIVLKSKCDFCGFIRYSAYENGIQVNEATYDGSDFFTVTEYPKHILVSERAKKVIEENGLTNVRFIESSKLKWPEGVIKP